MQPSNAILTGGVIIIGIGAINAALNNKPETPVFAGGIGVVLLASLLESLGNGWARLSVAFVGLATVSVILIEGPSLFKAIQNAQKGKV